MIAPGATPGAAARDTILARIREALRVVAPLPHLASHAAAPAADHGTLAILPAEAARPWLPDGGDSAGERRRILVENLERLRAVVHQVPDAAAAADVLAGLARARDWRRVAWHAQPLVEAVLSGVPCATHRVDDGGPFDKDALEDCDAGLTACDGLVAQTGSILVSSRSCGGRGLSILPHVHVVVATPDQIVATVGDALELARHRAGGRMPSMVSFITGPSRTGDIERILVLGAHGPKELVVILVGEDGSGAR